MIKQKLYMHNNFIFKFMLTIFFVYNKISSCISSFFYCAIKKISFIVESYGFGFSKGRKDGQCIFSKNAVIVIAPINPFVLVLSLQKELKFTEASVLLQQINSFVFESLKKNLPFSEIQKMALENFDWVLTEKSLCQIGDIIITTMTFNNLQIAQDLIKNFTLLNDLSSYIFKLPPTLASYVVQSVPDFAEHLHAGNASNLPELPLEHYENIIKESESFFSQIISFCQHHVLFLSFLAGTCVFTYVIYNYLFKPKIIEDCIQDLDNTTENLSSIYEKFYLFNFNLYLLSSILIICFVICWKKKNLLSMNNTKTTFIHLCTLFKLFYKNFILFIFFCFIKCIKHSVMFNRKFIFILESYGFKSSSKHQKIALMTATIVNPFAVIISLQTEGNIKLASELSQEVDNFLFECFQQDISFSEILKLALENDWLITEEALCEFADSMIKTVAQKNIEMGQQLIDCFTILNDVSTYVFKLPYKTGSLVIEAFQDLPEDLHLGNAANLPELPFEDVEIDKSFLSNLTEFCQNNLLLLTTITALCLCAYVSYKYFYQPQVITNCIEDIDNTNNSIASVYEIFYLLDIKIFIVIFIVIFIILLKTKVKK